MSRSLTLSEIGSIFRRLGPSAGAFENPRNSESAISEPRRDHCTYILERSSLLSLKMMQDISETPKIKKGFLNIL